MMEQCRAVTVSGKYKANKDHAGWVRMGLFHLLRGVLNCKKELFLRNARSAFSPLMHVLLLLIKAIVGILNVERKNKLLWYVDGL